MDLVLQPIKPDEINTESKTVSADCAKLLEMWNAFYPQIGYHPPWIGYYIKSGEEVIGSCALIKPENSDEAEISYWTFESYQGKGIATWACKTLVELGIKNKPGLQLIAKTEPKQNASTRVLERNNFKFSGVVQDDEIGDTWRWEYTL